MRFKLAFFIFFIILTNFKDQLTAAPSSCSSFIQNQSTLQLQTRHLRHWHRVGLWIESTFPCDNGVCFQGTTFDTDTNETLKPVEGHYSGSSLYFALILDPGRYENIRHYHGVCSERMDANGEYLNNVGRTLGTFFLSR